MLWIHDSRSHDPFFHVALEEYYLRRPGPSGDVLLFYINTPAVVIGRHQNPWTEVDMVYARQKGIPLVRRLSGGGTVYHDQGNLNLCFISAFRRGRRYAARRLFDPLVQFLLENAVSVQQNRRNDLLVFGRKISGNAQYTDLHRWLVHATLLVDAGLGDLRRVLAGGIRPKYSAAIDSRRSDVCNVEPYLSASASPESLKENLVQRYAAAAGGVSHFYPDARQQRAVSRLAEEKYRSWEWNFGKTPPFCVGGRIRLSDGVHSVLMKVKGGEVTTGKFTDPIRRRVDGFSREMLPDTRFDVLFDDGVFVPGSGAG